MPHSKRATWPGRGRKVYQLKRHARVSHSTHSPIQLCWIPVDEIPGRHGTYTSSGPAPEMRFGSLDTLCQSGCTHRVLTDTLSAPMEIVTGGGRCRQHARTTQTPLNRPTVQLMTMPIHQTAFESSPNWDHRMNAFSISMLNKSGHNCGGYGSC